MSQANFRNQPIFPLNIHFVAVLLLAVVLTGCGTMEAEVIFYQEEEWKYDAQLAVYKEWFEEEDEGEMVESYMSEMRTEIRNRAPGVEMDLERGRVVGDQVIYRLKIKGKGWDNLENVSDVAITQKGEEIRVKYPMSYMSDFEVSSITLQGSKIISSNADVVENGKATWRDPSGTLEAVLIPRQRVGWAPAAFGLVITAMGVFMLVSLYRM